MACFNFHVTLLANIAVEADTRDRAERDLRHALSGAIATFATAGSTPIVATVDIEGELDPLDDYSEREKDPQPEQ